MAAEAYDFEKLAKEITLARLQGSRDLPAAVADAVRSICVPAVTSTRERQDPRATIGAVCRGALGALLIRDQDLAAGAVALLHQMATTAQEAGLDPADCMTWAMEGMAPVCRLTSEAARDAVRAAIEENFMGAGCVFSEMLRACGAE